MESHVPNEHTPEFTPMPNPMNVGNAMVRRGTLAGQPAYVVAWFGDDPPPMFIDDATAAQIEAIHAVNESDDETERDP